MLEFTAVVEAAGRGGHVLVLPEDVASSLGARHLLRVRGTLAGASYRSNLVKSGDHFYLGVHKATLGVAGKQTGDEVDVTLEPDTEPR
ncbi:MAG TPA: DUF1905 domain-containing protein [Dehalococcoidia bacterium]|nr:DUF1905 domain-containing protein [Dehalococcoidia bacterium]